MKRNEQVEKAEGDTAKPKGIQSIKKRLCNPPGILVAAHGDPEVQGLFEGAGDGLAYGLEYAERIRYDDGDSAETIRAALYEFEKSVVQIESAYIRARKELAAETADSMKHAIDTLVAATGGEVYGGG